MKLTEKLTEIQRTLRVPKKRNNDFGNFKYRNLEDILEVFKKKETEYKVSLRFETKPVAVGSSIYIEAAVIFTDLESGEEIRSCAYAKEPPQPKAKMDESQCTGSATSYAKKYAFNNLFLLDDSIDPDSNQNIDSGEKASDAQIKQIETLCQKHNVNQAELYRKHRIKGKPSAAQAGIILTIFKKNFGDD
ncbi:ERF family protein [Murimonas intestini]|uniref:ERF family protein n=1 Tax=Murimonas intestini TaxID=1337051 RepID=UPI00248B6669|nr:ERF family protein [Murimonas intestini]